MVAPTKRWHRVRAPWNVVFIMASCYEWCIIKIVFARKGVNMNHDGGKLLCKHHINVSVRCENVLQIYLKYKYEARSNMRGNATLRGTHSHTQTHTTRTKCRMQKGKNITLVFESLQNKLEFRATYTHDTRWHGSSVAVALCVRRLPLSHVITRVLFGGGRSSVWTNF